MSWNSAKKNKNKYKAMKNKAKEAISRVIRENVEEGIAELMDCPIGIFRVVYV